MRPIKVTCAQCHKEVTSESDEEFKCTWLACSLRGSLLLGDIMGKRRRRNRSVVPVIENYDRVTVLPITSHKPVIPLADIIEDLCEEDKDSYSYHIPDYNDMDVWGGASQDIHHWNNRYNRNNNRQHHGNGVTYGSFNNQKGYWRGNVFVPFDKDQVKDADFHDIH